MWLPAPPKGRFRSSLVRDERRPARKLTSRFTKKGEPVLAGFELTPTAPLDELQQRWKPSTATGAGLLLLVPSRSQRHGGRPWCSTIWRRKRCRRRRSREQPLSESPGRAAARPTRTSGLSPFVVGESNFAVDLPSRDFLTPSPARVRLLVRRDVARASQPWAQSHSLPVGGGRRAQTRALSRQGGTVRPRGCSAGLRAVVLDDSGLESSVESWATIAAAGARH